MSTWGVTNEFLLAVKSTLDKLMYAVKQELLLDGLAEIGIADLDDAVQTDAVLGGAQPAVVFQFLDCSEAPRDPMWSVSFLIGAKTTDDSSNYQLHELHSKLASRFEVGSQMDIKNYSGDLTPTTNVGVGTITEAEVGPQQFDAQSGLRLSKITVMAIRL